MYGLFLSLFLHYNLYHNLKGSFLTVLFLFTLNTQAQEAHILFSQSNMSIYNPAFTGTQGSFVSLNSRSHWSGVDGAPKTNYLLYFFSKKEKRLHRFYCSKRSCFY